jgi:hypothetical protein
MGFWVEYDADVIATLHKSGKRGFETERNHASVAVQ